MVFKSQAAYFTVEAAYYNFEMQHLVRNSPKAEIN